MYTTEFKDFVTKAKEENDYVGIGNPNANILFVGKEPARTDEHYSKNAICWHNRISINKPDVYSYEVDENHVLRKGGSWGKNTWSKYQILKNHIDPGLKPDPYYINFLEKVFTTEINNAPSKNTSTADKSGLNERKQLFKNTAFIQSFPVVVLACSNYIKNNDKVREIDDIFGVNYSDDFPKKIYDKSNWFYSHYNNDKTKLVIHTRQLSANIHNQLLEDMGNLIREHLIKVNYY